MNRWQRWLGSHWMGGLSALLCLVSIGQLSRTWWPRARGPAYTEAVVPLLIREEMEPQVLAHIDEVEVNSRRIRADPRASRQQQGRAWGELGRVYTTYELWPQAVAACENASQLDRDDFRWPFLLACGFYRLPELDAAGRAMQEARSRITRDATARPTDQLAVVCFLAEVADKQGDAAAARPLLDEALRLNPRCLFALVMRGRLASEVGQYDDALRDLHEAVRLQPKSKEIRTLLATTYRRQGNLDKAHEWTVESTDKDRFPVAPPNPLLGELLRESRSSSRSGRLAVQLIQRGRYRSAVAELTTGLDRMPDNPLFLEKRAICFELLEQYADARQDLARLRELKPDLEAVRGQWLQVRAQLPQEREQALAEAREWTAEAPTQPVAWQALARCLMGCERYAEALPALEQAIALEESSPAPRLQLLECLGRLGDWERLERELAALVKEFPQESKIQLHWARFLACGMREQSRNPREALKIVDQQLKDRGTAVMLECQAAARHTLGETAAAEEAIRLAIEISGREATPAIQRRQLSLQRAIQTGKPFVEPWPFAGPTP